MFGFQQKRNLTLEEKLQLLEEVGVVLKPGRSIEELLGSYSRQEYEEEGFGTLLFVLSDEVQIGPDAGASYTRQLFSFDTECIEDNGDYARFATRFAEMFQDEFEISSIEDKVDWESKTAYLSFECQGKQYAIDPELDNDWFDPKVLGLFIQVSEDMNSRKKIGCAIPDGQSVRLCVMTPSQMKAFSKLTGLQMRVLTTRDL